MPNSAIEAGSGAGEKCSASAASVRVVAEPAARPSVRETAIGFTEVSAGEVNEAELALGAARVVLALYAP